VSSDVIGEDVIAGDDRCDAKARTVAAPVQVGRRPLIARKCGAGTYAPLALSGRVPRRSACHSDCVESVRQYGFAAAAVGVSSSTAAIFRPEGEDLGCSVQP